MESSPELIEEKILLGLDGIGKNSKADGFVDAVA